MSEMENEEKMYKSIIKTMKQVPLEEFTPPGTGHVKDVSLP